MKLILKPIFDPALHNIVITDSLFAVGRQEPPFSSYNKEAVAKLSRRHARIFQQNGEIYLADLGSQNGTTLNGDSVQPNYPEKLKDGDEICFAEELSFEVQISDFPEEADTQLITRRPSPILVLQAPKSAGAENIVVRQFPFLIGKANEVFLYDETSGVEAAKYLSRRHAHIFVKDGELYIEDLGSKNGTFVSGGRLDEHAIPLKEGDQIAFGREDFCFTVRLVSESDSADLTVAHPDSLAETRRLSTPASARLVLEATHQGERVEDICIAHFPFLIGKESYPFTRWKKRYPDKIKYLSRRHAQLIEEDGAVYLEDLGSKNGTFLAGARLEKERRLLEEGDAIAFGSDDFLFTVRFPLETDKVSLSTAQIAADPISEPFIGADVGTIYVSSSNTFLEIFCAQEAVAEKDGGEQTDQADKREKVGQKRAFGKPKVFFKELRQAFFGEQQKGSRRFWRMFGGAVLLLGLIAAVAYFNKSALEEVRTLNAQGRFKESVLLANRLLEKRPNDEKITALATEGLVKWVVPLWVEHIAKADFSAANGILGEARKISFAHRDGLKLIEFLEWVADLNRFFDERGGFQAPIEIFKHEAPMEALIGKWQSDQSDYRLLMRIVLEKAPEFEPLHAEIYSQVRKLQEEKALYLKAIADLKSRVLQNLADDRAFAITADLEEFKRKYASIKGIEALQADLQDYLAIQAAIAHKNLAEVLSLRAASRFRTPLFAERAAQLVKKELPSPDVISGYQRAFELWQAGQAKPAIEVLQSLTNRRWGEIATEQKAHYQTILREYQETIAHKDKKDYGERLLRFFSLLNPKEDAFFLRAIGEDLAQHKDKAFGNAAESWEAAQKQWDDYLKDGGIGSVIRVEKAVSEKFRSQADRLAQAYQSMSRALSIYDQLHQAYPPEWEPVAENIKKEARRQRQWLKDLQLVLNPDLLQTKLSLLPSLQEDHP